jgi:uncharacterized membrane protein HdeD (DUF308 family)
MAEFSFKKNSWFSKIESKEDALKVIKDTTTAFIAIAVLQAILSFFVGHSILIDGIINAGGAFFLRRFNSRVAAVVLLIVATISVGITIANLLGAELGTGTNILLAIIVFWAGVRAVEATFKFHGRFAEKQILK